VLDTGVDIDREVAVARPRDQPEDPARLTNEEVAERVAANVAALTGRRLRLPQMPGRRSV
jgi:hypothetical protein